MLTDSSFSHSNWTYSGRASKLPPRIPIQGAVHTANVNRLSPPKAKMNIPVPKEEHIRHQRTSSESFIFDEQPSWLNDLLDEPETPVGRGMHRRSSSDSVAYLDISGALLKAAQFSQAQCNSVRRPANKDWETIVDTCGYQNSVASAREWLVEKHEADRSDMHAYGYNGTSKRGEILSTQQAADKDLLDQKGITDYKDSSFGKPATSDSDSRRAKQNFARRSRARKLQYIAELEHNVGMLEAEGSDVAAELAFLKQQNLILRLENNALKQRLNSIAREKQIKEAQYELLRKEVERLWHVYSNQQKEMLNSQSHGQPSSSVIEAADRMNLQFGCLSLSSSNHQESDLAKDSVSINGLRLTPA